MRRSSKYEPEPKNLRDYRVARIRALRESSELLAVGVAESFSTDRAKSDAYHEIMMELYYRRLALERRFDRARFRNPHPEIDEEEARYRARLDLAPPAL